LWEATNVFAWRNAEGASPLCRGLAAFPIRLPSGLLIIVLGSKSLNPSERRETDHAGGGDVATLTSDVLLVGSKMHLMMTSCCSHVLDYLSHVLDYLSPVLDYLSPVLDYLSHVLDCLSHVLDCLSCFSMH
jgi:hypothetical protein